MRRSTGNADDPAGERAALEAGLLHHLGPGEAHLRERQLAGESTQADTQNELFETVKLSAAAHDASRGIAENVLLEDYGKLLGGKARLQQFALPQLSRLGFIERRNKIIHEGPLLDLAFDYAEFAPRILEGALSDLLKQRGVLEDHAQPNPALEAVAGPEDDA